MKLIIPLICVLIAGCTTTPKECDQIIREHIDESNFWIRSIVYSESPRPDTCNAVVTAISVHRVWESYGRDLVFYENRIVVGSTITRYADGSITHITQDNVSNTKKITRVVPSESLAKKIAAEWDAKASENDICSGLAAAVLKGESLGRSQAYCKVPVAVTIYENERMR
jgi:hypothetical protein